MITLTRCTALAACMFAGPALAQAPAGAAMPPATSASAPAAAASAVAAAPAAVLSPFESAADGAPPAAWREVGLPPEKVVARTLFAIADGGGSRALRITSDRSYGALVHAWRGPARTLQWSWRLDRQLASADLRRKDGDDNALKVCVMFDMPLANVPWLERTALGFARRLTGEPLPTATLCYVWDTQLPTGTLIENAHTGRLRYLVLDSGPPKPGWQAHSRDLHADFAQAFGKESDKVPAVTAVAVGADSDNTRGNSLAWVTGMRLTP